MFPRWARRREAHLCPGPDTRRFGQGLGTRGQQRRVGIHIWVRVVLRIILSVVLRVAGKVIEQYARSGEGSHPVCCGKTWSHNAR
jgi:hypothetical protein